MAGHDDMTRTMPPILDCGLTRLSAHYATNTHTSCPPIDPLQPPKES